jgi:hypothetical protein
MVPPERKPTATRFQRCLRSGLRNRTEYPYDGLQRLAGADWKDSGGSWLFAFEFAEKGPDVPALVVEFDDLFAGEEFGVKGGT